MKLETFNKVYNQGLNSFAEQVYIDTHQWSIGYPVPPAKRGMFFLYLYALSSWDQDAFGNYLHSTNFLTETQVGSVISRIKEL